MRASNGSSVAYLAVSPDQEIRFWMYAPAVTINLAAPVSAALALMFIILLAQFNSFYNAALVLVAVVLSTREYERLHGLNVQEFESFCDAVAERIQQRGLTEEALDELLADD